jgi:hypothetical protein
VDPEVVEAAAAMAACSCCDMTSVVATAAVAWIVVMVVVRSDGTTPAVAEVTMMVSKSVGGGVAMTKVGVEVDLSQSGS